MNDGLRRLNTQSREEAEAALLTCCGSTRWVRRMANRRSFPDMEALLQAAGEIWWELGREDWLEAFSRHPKIGEKRAAQATSAEARRWSEEEQAGTRDALAETQAALREGNLAYQERFGYIFIVCATGKSSEEMLALLEQRLQNDVATEFRIAAEEQRRITRLRLEKLLQA